MRALWPVGEAAQADYEVLREAALSGVGVASAVAARFARVGLAGLIVAPAAAPMFSAALAGATRPAWTPYDDPRHQALVAAYELVVAVADGEAFRGGQTASTATEGEA